jgi:hypothetical protein
MAPADECLQVPPRAATNEQPTLAEALVKQIRRRNSIMHLAKGLTIATALAAVLTAAGLAPVQALDLTPQTMKPMAGMSFNLGTKHAASYFLADNGTCKLTLTVADAFDGNEVPSGTSTRFEVGIDSGKSARFDAIGGNALEFKCHVGAQAMSVETREQLAAYPPRAN